MNCVRVRQYVAATRMILWKRAGMGIMFLCLAAPLAFGAVLRVGPDKPFKSVRAAAQAVQSGDTVEIDPGTYSRDVATWRGTGITIRGVGATRPHMSADGTSEGGKGIWVIQGANYTVENIEFSGAAVADRNGAGIRAESTGTLTVRNCYFHDNENGILGPNDGNAELIVENSIFERNGFGDGYSHNMYVGRINKFRLQCSYSHQARSGHNVKSRARNNYILYSRIMDEDIGDASYEVDIPEGGRSFLVGNIIQKGPNAQNSSVISYALENANAGVLDLVLASNTIVNERPGGGQFLQLRPGTNATVVNNILYGPGVLWTTDGVKVASDHNYVEPALNNSPGLADPAKFDYHLKPDSPCRDAGALPPPVDGYSLIPASQYIYDAQCSQRATVGPMDIGAFEYNPTSPDEVFFPQVVIGGGFSTVFSVMNAGAETASGSLVLTDDSGSPLPARLTGISPAPAEGVSSALISIPAGGTSIVTATAVNTADPAKKGWARIESSGGAVWGSATIRLVEAGTTLASVGVLGSQTTDMATIPVDNDDTRSRFVGFAVANPGDSDLRVTLATLDEDGHVLDITSPEDLNPLGARKQVARFLHEYLAARLKFRGAMVLWSRGGEKFAVVSLLQNQGRFTAIPVVAALPPQIQRE